MACANHGQNRSSRIAGFHRKSPQERLDLVAAFAGLDPKTTDHLADMGNLAPQLADKLIENVVATMNVPIGVATNMKIDGEDVLVPWRPRSRRLWQPSAMPRGRTTRQASRPPVSGNLMIAQVQAVDVPDPHAARLRVLERRDEIKAICDECDPILLSLGGGFRDLEVRILDTLGGTMLITHLIVDTRDAMGANAVNTMAEKVRRRSPPGAADGFTCASYPTSPTAALLARTPLAAGDIGGPEVRDGIISAYQFAAADPYRAATHNKGIMNGISAVILATGNDTRAVEAGAHAYAARSGRYSSLTHYEVTAEGISAARSNCRWPWA